MAPSRGKRSPDPAAREKLEAAVKELFSQEDFHHVNMRRIAQKTGLGLNTIYLQYESKERLLFHFLDGWIRDLDNRLAEHLQGLDDTKEKIRKTVWVILDFYEKNPDISTIVTMTMPFKTWMTDDTFKQKDLSVQIIGLLQEGRQRTVLDPDIPAELMFDILYAVIHRMVYMWLYLGKKERLTAKANLYFDIIWRAIRNPAAEKTA